MSSKNMMNLLRRMESNSSGKKVSSSTPSPQHDNPTMMFNPLANPSINHMHNQSIDLDDDDDDVNVDVHRNIRGKSHVDSTSQHVTPETPSSQVSTTTSRLKPRKKTSWVWEYFTPNHETQKAKCTICLAILSCKTGENNTGTGHLIRHLRNHNVKGPKIDEEGVGVQTTIDPKTGKVFFFNKIHYRLETMKFAIGSALPFSFADGWRYKKWISEAVNPQADRIPRTSLRTIAFQYFDFSNH